MLDSMQQMQKMGPVGQVMSMIPGMGNLAGEAQAAVDRGDLKRTEAIIRAMTAGERRDPAILNGSRRRRIAAGSGTSLPEVNRLVKQFGEMQKLMKAIRGRREACRGNGLVHGPALSRRRDRDDRIGADGRPLEPTQSQVARTDEAGRAGPYESTLDGAIAMPVLASGSSRRQPVRWPVAIGLIALVLAVSAFAGSWSLAGHRMPRCSDMCRTGPSCMAKPASTCPATSASPWHRSCRSSRASPTRRRSRASSMSSWTGSSAA